MSIVMPSFMGFARTQGSSSAVMPLPLLSNVTTAYGYARKLGPSHTGNTYLRYADDAELVVGYKADNTLDTAALLTFANGGKVVLKTWQDATGGTIHATQTDKTKMAIVVDTSGNLITQNGAPSVLFDGSNDNYITSGLVNAVSFTVACVLGEKLIYSDATANKNHLFYKDATHYLDSTSGANLFLVQGSSGLNTYNTFRFPYYSLPSNNLSTLLVTKNNTAFQAQENNKVFTNITGNFASGLTATLDNIGASSDSYWGYLNEIIVFNGNIISTDDKTTLLNSNNTFYNINPSATKIWCVGDSITYGYYYDPYNITQSWPAQLSNNLGSDYRVFNRGASGDTASGFISGYFFAGVPYDNGIALAKETGLKNIAIVAYGTNDIVYGANAATTYSRLKTLCQSIKSHGVSVVIATILPRATSVETFEADRQTVNQNIRDYAISEGWADVIADVGADATIGAEGANTNTTYYLDGTHPTSAGYAIYEGIVRTAVLSI